MVHELVLEDLFERWFIFGYLLVHMLLCLLSLVDGLYWGYSLVREWLFLELGMVYEFDLLVRGLHP